MHRRRGSVLIVMLWVVSILVLFAIGLGYRASLYLRSGRTQRDALKASAASLAGIAKAETVFEAQLERSKPAKTDPEKTYTYAWPATGQSFSVGYYDQAGKFALGLRDEARKISVNGHSEYDGNKLAELFEARNVDDARALAEYTRDWIDPQGKNPLAKRQDVVALPELSAVFEGYYREKGRADYAAMAEKALASIQDIATVYSAGKVNLNTCSQQALAIVVAASLKTSGIAAAAPADQPSVVQKIIQARQAGAVFTRSDPQEVAARIEEHGIQLSSGEKDIINQLFQQGQVTVQSDVAEITSVGQAGDVTRTLRAVYDRKEHRMLWLEEK